MTSPLHYGFSQFKDRFLGKTNTIITLLMDSWIYNSSIMANGVDLDITCEYSRSSTDMLMVLAVTLLQVATAQSNNSVCGKYLGNVKQVHVQYRTRHFLQQ